MTSSSNKGRRRHPILLLEVLIAMAMAAGGCALVWKGPVALLRGTLRMEEQIAAQWAFDLFALEQCTAIALQPPHQLEGHCRLPREAARPMPPIDCHWKLELLQREQESPFEPILERWRLSAQLQIQGKIQRMRCSTLVQRPPEGDDDWDEEEPYEEED